MRRNGRVQLSALTGAAVLAIALVGAPAMATEHEPPPAGPGGSPPEAEAGPPPEESTIDAPPEAPGVPDVEPFTELRRLSGPDRYATAADLSLAFPVGGTVYVASGLRFPDALSGGPGAASYDAPVLLVSETDIPQATADALERLDPEQIVVLGGPVAVPEVVVGALRAHAPVRRLAGPDRYATAAAVSRDAFAPGTSQVYIATGGDFPDALAAAGRGAWRQDPGPVLLVPPSGLTRAITDELQRLEPREIVVVGQQSAVPDTTLTQLRGYGPVRRVAGSHWSQTSALLVRDYPREETPAAIVVTGRNFPDALAVASAAGLTDAPVLLVDPTQPLTGTPRDALLGFSPLPHTLAVGGSHVISEEYLHKLYYLLNPGVAPLGQPALRTAGPAATGSLYRTTDYAIVGGGRPWDYGVTVYGTPGSVITDSECDLTSHTVSINVSASVEEWVRSGTQLIYFRIHSRSLTTGQRYTFPNGSWYYKYVSAAPGGILWNTESLGHVGLRGYAGHEYELHVELWRSRGSNGWAGPQVVLLTPHRLINGLRMPLSQGYTICAT